MSHPNYYGYFHGYNRYSEHQPSRGSSIMRPEISARSPFYSQRPVPLTTSYQAESGRTRAPAPVRFQRWTAPPHPGYPFKAPMESDYEWRSQMPPASFRDPFDKFPNGEPFGLPSPNSSAPESPFNSSWPQSPAASPFSSHSSPFPAYAPSPSPNFRGYHHRRSSPPMPPLHLPPPHVHHQYGPAANMRQENHPRWDRQPQRPRRDYNFPARARKRARSYAFTHHHLPTAKRSHGTHIEPRTSVKPLRRPEIAVKSVQREDYPFELGSNFWPEPVPTENVDIESGATASPLSQRISPKDKISWQGSPPSYTTLNNMVSLRERSRTTLSTQKALGTAVSKTVAKSAPVSKSGENLDVVDSSPDLPPEEKIWTDLESSFRELFSPWIEGPEMTELEKLIQERKSQIVYTDQQNTHVLRHGIRTLVDDFRAMLTNLSTDRIREEDFLKKFVGSFSDNHEGPVDDLFMSDDKKYDVGLHRQDEIFLQTIRSALLNSVQMLNDRVPYIGPVYL